MFDFDGTGIDLFDDESLLQKSGAPQAKQPGGKNYDFSPLIKDGYNPIDIASNWVEGFKNGVNHIKRKIQDDEEMQYLSTQPIVNLSEQDKQRVYDYALKEKNKSLLGNIAETTVESFVKAGENIANLDFYKPEQGIIDIVKRGDLDTFEKFRESGKTVLDVAYKNTIGNFDGEEYMQITGDMAFAASEKIKNAINSGDTTGILAGGVEFIFAPVGSLFDERNTGALTASVGQGLDSFLVTTRSAVVESTKYLGYSQETGENLSTLMETFVPAKVMQYKLAGLSERAAMKAAVTSVKSEITNLYGIDPAVRDAYVSAKTQQYGPYTYAKGVEKFDKDLEQARSEGNLEAIKSITGEIEKFNAEKYASLGRNILASAALKVEGFTDALGIKTKLQFIDNGKEVPYLDFSGITFGKGSDKLLQQDVTKKALQDLAGYWQEKGLADIKNAEVKASVEQYLKDTGLTEINRKAFSNNLLQELRARGEVERMSISNLYDISLNKSLARDKYLKAKADKYEGILPEKEFTKIQKEYKKTLDDINDHKKFDEINYQVAIGNMREVGVDGPFTTYAWTEKGMKYLPPAVRNSAVGYHFPTKLKDDIQNKATDKQVNIIEKRMEQSFDEIIGEKSKKSMSSLEKSFRKSGMTYEGYVQRQIDKYLQDKKLLGEMEMEIMNSQKVDTVYVEGDVGMTSKDTIWGGSTFPKWIPENLRNKSEMLEAWEKFTKGEIVIPEKIIKGKQTKKSQRLQDLMGVYLQRVGSPLAEMFDTEFRKVSSSDMVERNRKLVELNKQAKEFGKAFFTEYKKSKTELKNYKEKFETTKASLEKKKESWKKKYEEKTQSNRDRRGAVRTFQAAFELSDIELHKVIGNKDYLSFKTDYEFDIWLKEAQKKADEIIERKSALLQLQATIALKELNNTQNLMRVYDLPLDTNKWDINDIRVFEAILDEYEKGDTFISPSLIKRFEIVGEERIKTVREAREALVRDLGEYYDIPLDEFEGSLYETRIKELKERLSQEETAEARALIEQEISEIEKEARDMSLRKGIADQNFKPKSEKDTNEKVTEKKLIKGSYLDKITPDQALVNQNPLYKFMVTLYNESRIKTLSNIETIQNTLGEKLSLARKSRPRGLLDRLIPTDDAVFQYLEADAGDKVSLARTLTEEELDLANYVAGLFSDFRKELTQRNVMDNFRQNYITNLQKDWKEILKTEGFTAAMKSIFKNQENTIDFGALGGSDEVLGFEKFFKFSLQRTGEFDPSKDIGKAVMAYTNTYYKKVALDETIPKIVLYKNLIADSKADKFIIQWLNNKKGITALPELQGTSIDKIVSGLKQAVSVLDLGFNPITAAASMGGIMLSNYIGFGATGIAKGLTRKASPQGRAILKQYSAEIGRNPLWNIHQEILNAPDVPPLEKPMQLAFVMLGQTLQSGLNTAFLAKLTKQEYTSGVVSSKRIAQIFQELGATHALPGTQSVYGSTFIGKLAMMYKSWAVPLIYTNSRNARKILNKTATKKDVAQFVRGIIVPATLLVMAHKIFQDDLEEDYVLKRFLQEVTSSIGAMDLKTWLAIPRPAQFILSLYESLQGLATAERYKTTKDGEYEEGDLKFYNQIEKLFTPGAIKSSRNFIERSSGSDSSDSSAGSSDISDIDLGDIDLSDIDLSDIDMGDISDIDLGDIDLSDIDLSDIEI